MGSVAASMNDWGGRLGNRWLYELLACPKCGRSHWGETHGAASALPGIQCLECGYTNVSANGIPRFVEDQGYAASFGFQWNRFRTTQLDSHCGVPISARRFYAQSGWSAAELSGKTVLEIGCGAGRFTEVVLATGARLVSVDYSNAVDTCSANLGLHENLAIVQADIFDLPFRRDSFDYVFCFGVLQHTPDPEGAFRALVPLLKPGGKIAVDIYRKHWANLLHSKYWLRPAARRLPSKRLFELVERWAPRLIPVSNVLGAVPGIGRLLRRMIPVANYTGILPLSREQIREWAILDTFDWLSPTFDNPRT